MIRNAKMPTISAFNAPTGFSSCMWVSAH